MFVFRLVRRVVTLVVLVAVVAALVVAGRVWWVGRQDDARPSDVIVVLGASQYDGRPSTVLAARLDHAKALYERKIASRVITVGGSQPGDRFTEGGSGRTYLVHAGLPKDRVTAVEEGSDTLTSLRAVDALMTKHRWHTAVVVTDRWHSLRSRTIARDLGIDAVTSPAPDGPAQSGVAALRYIARESVAYVFYRVFHRGAGGDAPAAV